MPPEPQEILVEKSAPGERLDTFLRKMFPPISRGTFQRLLEEGCITVNGKSVKATHTPRAGEKIFIVWPEVKPATAQPEDIPLHILFEDEFLLVLNKPAGLVVHPAAGHDKHTLVNALLHHCQGELSGIGGVARPGIVHRLDKETSGCLVVAKHDAAHLELARQFAGRSIQKIYHALVCGELAVKQGEIKTSIARHPTHRKRMAVITGGRNAWTSFSVTERFRGATLVEALLHTGRTHQIRVHFLSIGHPLVGDLVYGKKQNKQLAESGHFQPARHMLHAFQLGFNHPGTGKPMTFTAPWPEDFEETIRHYRALKK